MAATSRKNQREGLPESARETDGSLTPVWGPPYPTFDKFLTALDHLVASPSRPIEEVGRSIDWSPYERATLIPAFERLGLLDGDSRKASHLALQYRTSERQSWFLGLLGHFYPSELRLVESRADKVAIREHFIAESGHELEVAKKAATFFTKMAAESGLTVRSRSPRRPPGAIERGSSIDNSMPNRSKQSEGSTRPVRQATANDREMLALLPQLTRLAGEGGQFGAASKLAAQYEKLARQVRLPDET